MAEFNKSPLKANDKLIPYSEGLENRIESSFSEIADYVVETGENANGSWEKWNSGKLVQHVTADLGIIQFDVLTSGTYPAKTYPWLDLPIPFINNEYTCASPNFYGVGFLGIAIHTKDSYRFRVKLWSWGATSFNVVADFSFEGRWK